MQETPRVPVLVHRLIFTSIRRLVADPVAILVGGCVCLLAAAFSPSETVLVWMLVGAVAGLSLSGST